MTTLQQLKDLGVTTFIVKGSEAMAVNPYEWHNTTFSVHGRNENIKRLRFNGLLFPPLPTFNIPNGDISIEEVEEVEQYLTNSGNWVIVGKYNIPVDVACRSRAALILKQVKEEEPKADIPEYYPGIEYQELFDLMSEEHGLILLKSEMDDIIHIAVKISKGTTLEP